jgi:hypothetical protein
MAVVCSGGFWLNSPQMHFFRNGKKENKLRFVIKGLPKINFKTFKTLM